MKKALTLILACFILLTGTVYAHGEDVDMQLKLNENEAVIYLAGGCFWGMEKLMSLVPGVVDAVSGYANGTAENPTYEEVCSGLTGHRETVRVIYSPEEVSLNAILSVYFGSIDPTVKDRQAHDVGSQYQTGIYYADPNDEAIIRAVCDTERSRYDEFYVEIAPLTAFYEAETYHQDYLDKNPGGYCHISVADFERAKNLKIDPADYQKPSDAELKRTLTEEQYAVTQQAATEAPFNNEYWQNADDGLYVDITTGEPMFTSADKYQSSCGWPAFGKPLDDNALFYAADDSLGRMRTEVKSRVGNAHLGHVFTDDAESPTGTRYCINSAALRFIPYEQMEAEGYGEYMQYVRPVAEYRKLTAEEAKRMMDDDPSVMIVDVRRLSEYENGHIPGAILLPVDNIGKQPPELLPDKHATILLYCRSGVRSRDAANKLIDMGYTGVYDMGGIIDWKYEVEK